VDWYPWGEEDDFTKAQAEDKHIFLLSGVIEDQYGYFPKLELWPCQL